MVEPTLYRLSKTLEQNVPVPLPSLFTGLGPMRTSLAIHAAHPIVGSQGYHLCTAAAADVLRPHLAAPLAEWIEFEL